MANIMDNLRVKVRFSLGFLIEFENWRSQMHDKFEYSHGKLNCHGW